MRYLEVAEKREHKEAEGLERLYVAVLTPLIENKRTRLIFKLVMWGSFLFTLSFFYFKWVPVKMLPLDNKPEFSVVIDMPEGTALPVTANLAHRMADQIRSMPEVTAIQLYAGTARPFDFNGMVRHYYLRSDPWQGELQVQLTNKHDRKRSSHEIATAARELIKPLLEESGAHAAVVEMPPGPPVLQSVVAEVHGPTAEIRRAFAQDLTDIFKQAESARDVDNYMRENFDYWRFDVDTEKAVRRGISVDTINQNLSMALGGAPLGDVKMKSGHEPVRIVVQVPLAERSEIDRLGDLPIRSNEGFTVPLRELGRFERVAEEDIIFRKDLRAIEYVVADVGGTLAAPTYAMMQVQNRLDELGYVAPDGVKPEAYWLGPPPSDTVSAFEWAGEWTVTYETFRDMGAAFMVALVLIYILVVWEFGNFRIPLVIMAPIPLTLLGIIPAHWLAFQLGFGGEFTATSMIGWIALAGIIVRNSILLVDFSIHEVQKGVPVAEAVIRACKTRTRPIVITALALVAGSSVIFTDPIFQGMAISLSSGVLVSTLLTLIVIPLGCVAASKDLCEVAVASAPAGMVVPCAEGLVDETHEQSQRSGAKPAGSPVLAKIGNILVLVLYGIRGLFLLLFDWIQGFFKKKRPRATPPRGSSPPSSKPDVARIRRPRRKGAAGSDIGAAGAGETVPNALKTAPQRAAAEVSDAAAVKPTPEPSSKSSPAPAPTPASDSGACNKPQQERRRRRPRTPAKKVAKKKAKARPSQAGSESRTTAAKVQKKAPRRGIRLKTGDGDQGSFD